MKVFPFKKYQVKINQTETLHLSKAGTNEITESSINQIFCNNGPAARIAGPLF